MHRVVTITDNEFMENNKILLGNVYSIHIDTTKVNTVRKT